MAAVSDISRALDLYYDRYGSYPDVVDKDYGDWDTTFEPGGGKVEFIPQLLKEGILNSVPRDPINNKVYFYRYKNSRKAVLVAQNLLLFFRCLILKPNKKPTVLALVPIIIL